MGKCGCGWVLGLVSRCGWMCMGVGVDGWVGVCGGIGGCRWVWLGFVCLWG